MELEFLLETIGRTPLAILPSRWAAIRNVLARRAHGGRLSEADIPAAIGDDTRRAQGREVRDAGQGVAVIPLYGEISHRAEHVDDVSGPGGTSTQRFGVRLREALADQRVGSVVIDVDSPGGMVNGVPELADQVFAARGEKPIVAVANTLAASAAYWIASQADELVVTPSGQVGSIGVFAAHEDISGLMAREGRDVTLISAGRYKVEGNPFEPLSAKARAAMQRQVDEAYDIFVGAVARGRSKDTAPVTANVVRKGFGQGRLVWAQRAVAAGMADRIGTLEATVARLQRPGAANGADASRAFEFDYPNLII